MQGRLVEFIEGLRRADIPVTLSETLDAVRALAEVRIEDRELFRDALKTTLVKRRPDQGEFDRLFELYFSHLQQDLHLETPEGETAPECVTLVLEAAGMADAMGPALSSLGRAVLEGHGLVLEQLALKAAQAVNLSAIQSPLQVGLFTRRMAEQFDWSRLEEEIQGAIRFLGAQGASPQEIARLAELVGQNRDAFRALLRRLAERELAKNAGPLRRRLVADSLLGKSFASLSDQEIRQMQEVVARLVQRLRTKVALLERRHRQGKLDIRRTLRHSLQYGGTPAKLVFKEKRRKKAQIMALCDVSSSVWTASRFMLNLLYAMQDQFARVRSFVFVSDLGEVTEFFARYETNEAIAKALKEAGISYFSYTDYGDVLLRFHEEYLGDVNTRTVVIVIGDGRNNHLPAQAWVLEAVRGRAKQVVWLNPEPRSTWSLGDSIMHEYMPHCTQVRECRNLRQLSKFVEELAL